MPTLLGFLGVSIPDGVEGDDLSGLLCGSQEEGAEIALMQYESPYFPPAPKMAFRAIRHGRYLYTYFLTQGPTQLFDLGNDPYEMTNLIGLQEHADTRKRLHATMKAKLTELEDDFLERAKAYVTI